MFVKKRRCLHGVKPHSPSVADNVRHHGTCPHWRRQAISAAALSHIWTDKDNDDNDDDDDDDDDDDTSLLRTIHRLQWTITVDGNATSLLITSRHFLLEHFLSNIYTLYTLVVNNFWFCCLVCCNTVSTSFVHNNSSRASNTPATSTSISNDVVWRPYSIELP